MKAAEGKIGRVFILRLEDDDIVPGCIEKFAAEKGIKTGLVNLVGCFKKGDVISGPREKKGNSPELIKIPVDGAHETLAMGIIAPDKEGRPVLHIHGALGRAGHTTTGCLRSGVTVWYYSEAVLYEIEDIEARRLLDQETGFIFLNMEEEKGKSITLSKDQ